MEFVIGGIIGFIGGVVVGGLFGHGIASHAHAAADAAIARATSFHTGTTIDKAGIGSALIREIDKAAGGPPTP